MAYTGVGGLHSAPCIPSVASGRACTRGRKGAAGQGRRAGRWAAPGASLLEHVLQRPRQVLEHRVQDAVLLLLLLVPAARRDGLLGPGQAPLAGLLQGRLLLSLLLLLLLQPVLGTGRAEVSGNRGSRGLALKALQTGVGRS